jgi:hypothetical protein
MNRTKSARSLISRAAPAAGLGDRPEPHEIRPLSSAEPRQRPVLGGIGLNRPITILVAERRKPPGSGANACRPAAKNVGVEVPYSTITSSGLRTGRLTPLR